MADTGHEGFAGSPDDAAPGAFGDAAAGAFPVLPCVIERVPLFSLQNVVLFPGAILPLHVFEQRYRAMAADALGLKCSRTCSGPMDGRRLICMPRIQPDHDPMHDQPPLFDVACLGRILHHEKLADGRYNLLLQGVARVRLGREHPLGDGHDRKPYRRADLHLIQTSRAFEIDVADERQRLRAICTRPPILGTPLGRQLGPLFTSAMPTVQLADVLAFHLVENIAERQALLEEADERGRVERLCAIMERQFPDTTSVLCAKGRFDASEA